MPELSEAETAANAADASDAAADASGAVVEASDAPAEASNTADALAVVLEANLPTFVAGHTKIVGALRRCDKSWRDALGGLSDWNASLSATKIAERRLQTATRGKADGAICRASVLRSTVEAPLDATRLKEVFGLAVAEAAGGAVIASTLSPTSDRPAAAHAGAPTLPWHYCLLAAPLSKCGTLRGRRARQVPPPRRPALE